MLKAHLLSVIWFVIGGFGMAYCDVKFGYHFRTYGVTLRNHWTWFHYFFGFFSVIFLAYNYY